ncbi:MAG TPA: MFS transporter [Tepidisphaeraceae bacterium]|nr:MFS transporter [Tepidisphaeraceae bacterium]
MTETLAISTPDATRALGRFARVMPLAFITYGLAYLDRVNYASAEPGLSGSLHLSATMGPIVLASFFLGYCLFQIPGAIYAARRSVKRLIFWALLLWGILSGLTGVIRDVPLLIADRVLLGAVEGVVLPAMLIYLTRWFTRPERSRANSLLMLTNPVTMATASALCGVLIQYFDTHPRGTYVGWQMMFIVEGLPSVLWAFGWWWLADERPGDAEWLLPQEAAAVQAALDHEQQTIGPMRGYWQAFGDWNVIKLSAMFMCFCSASYGLMMWLPGIVAQGARQRPAAAGFLTSLPYDLAIFSMLAVAWLSDRTLRRKRYVVGSMVVGCLAFCVSYAAGPQNFLVAFLGLIVVGSCIYTPTAPLWAWMAEMLPRNVAGESMALVNSFGAFGGFLGSMIVGLLKNHYQSNGAAFMFQAICFALAGVLAASARSRDQGTP